MKPPIYQLRDVSYRYRQVTALDRVSLEIEFGRRVALLGANGCGKSTLLRILNGLYFPESGTVNYNGYPLTQALFHHDEFAWEFRRRIGLVFQNPDVQLFCPTVFDEVAFGPLQLGWGKDEIRRRVSETLEEFEIAHLKDRAPYQLSGGEKKRVAIAAVVILNPDVLLLDEPTAALDPRSQAQVIDLMRKWEEAGKTTVIATHDLHVLDDIVDECVVLDSGRIVARGTPADIVGDANLLRTANLIEPGGRR